MAMEQVYLTIVLAPLLAAIVAGFGGPLIGRTASHLVCILGVALSFALSVWVLKLLVVDGMAPFNGTVYVWGVSDGIQMEVGFLVDPVGADDDGGHLRVADGARLHHRLHARRPGYQRFFAYISLFTFAMLMLVMSNNFLQLFFGWEAVGLVSYLLIGFWYKRPTAIFANYKAFVVNRVGDFGFVLGIAGIVFYTGTLDYAEAFSRSPT
jgi:NADH-quinone oxidoreductase subunit L